MATQAEIDALANRMASETTIQRNSMPASWNSPAYLPQMTQHMMKGQARAMIESFDTPWVNITSTNTARSDTGRFATGWFNKGIGYAVGACRRVPLLGKVEMRGVIYATSVVIGGQLLYLPIDLEPQQNELFQTTVMDNANVLHPAVISIYTDGTVNLWFTTATSISHLTLSGISYEVS